MIEGIQVVGKKKRNVKSEYGDIEIKIIVKDFQHRTVEGIVMQSWLEEMELGEILRLLLDTVNRVDL